MTTPEWLKPGIYGAVLGATAIAIIGFSWGGWMTGGGARKMADTYAQDNVIEALLPLCLENSRTDTDRTAKLAGIRDASTYQRRDAVMETGWATMPGSDAPNRDLAQACIGALELDAS